MIDDSVQNDAGWLIPGWVETAEAAMPSWLVLALVEERVLIAAAGGFVRRADDRTFRPGMRLLETDIATP